MNTNGIVILAGGIVIVSSWAKGHPLGFRTMMGVAFAGFGISVIGDFSPQLGEGFALLMLLSAVLNAAGFFQGIAKAVA